jgi:hypothetical protein
VAKVIGTSPEVETGAACAGSRTARATRTGLLLVTTAGLISGFSLVLEILIAGVLVVTAVLVTVAVLAPDRHAGRSRPERALLLIGMLLDRSPARYLPTPAEKEPMNCHEIAGTHDASGPH